MEDGECVLRSVQSEWNFFYIVCILENLVPGVLYGAVEEDSPVKVSLGVPMLELEAALRQYGRSVENTVFQLTLPDDTKRVVVPRQIQVHPCK